jgi:hypothetical protein
MTDHPMRSSFVPNSREELIRNYALDAYEETIIPNLEGWNELTEEQRGIVFDALEFGVQAACAVLGETGTFEDEYQAMLKKLREASVEGEQ